MRTQKEIEQRIEELVEKVNRIDGIARNTRITNPVHDGFLTGMAELLNRRQSYMDMVVMLKWVLNENQGGI